MQSQLYRGYRYVDQGGNKRPGAFAIYLEPWHPDIFEFLDLRKNTGEEEQRTRDLFNALWIPDLFMQRVEDDADWSFMCPKSCPGLSDCWGKPFEDLYTKYEREGRFVKQMKAQKVWFAILESQIETGGYNAPINGCLLQQGYLIFVVESHRDFDNRICPGVELLKNPLFKSYLSPREPDW